MDRYESTHPQPPRITPTEELKPKPDYFMLHQYLGRSTKDCYYNLRRKYHDKVASRKVEMKKNDILNKPLPKHDKKESCSTIIGFDEMMAEFQEIPHSLEEVHNPNMQARTLMEGTKFKWFF